MCYLWAPRDSLPDFENNFFPLRRVSPETRRLADSFASAEGKGRRYAFGCNELSLELSKVFGVDAFVDDFAAPGSVWLGKPVINGTEIPSNAIVANCVICARPVSAARRLRSLKVAGVLDFTDLCLAFPNLLALPKFIVQTRQDFLQHKDKWQCLAKSLEDAESRQVLADVLTFRMTGDCNSMNAYSVRFKDQYFEDFLGLSHDEVFVDAGGFDGDTTEEFCRRYPGYRNVFLFEPSPENMRKARKRLSELINIEFIEKGLSDAGGTLWFNNAGNASAIGEVGSYKIAVTTLDDQVLRRTSLIKMDVEGWELKALQGSRRHIVEDHPKLAITPYHNPSHFWQIFEFITSLRQDYAVFLRHYSEGWIETVMYFVPK